MNNQLKPLHDREHRYENGQALNEHRCETKVSQLQQMLHSYHKQKAEC